MTDLFSLKGKVALIAGASKEMGGAIARMLAEYGADVAVSARSADKLETVAADIRAMGRRAATIPANLTKVEEIDATVERTVKELGGLDILVNVLGGSRDGGTTWALRMEEKMWDEVVTLNMKAPMFLSVAAAKVMKERGGGSIVNISTSAATGAAPRLANYGFRQSGPGTTDRNSRCGMGPIQNPRQCGGVGKRIYVEPEGDSQAGSGAATDRSYAAGQIGHRPRYRRRRALFCFARFGMGDRREAGGRRRPGQHPPVRNAGVMEPSL